MPPAGELRYAWRVLASLAAALADRSGPNLVLAKAGERLALQARRAGRAVHAKAGFRGRGLGVRWHALQRDSPVLDPLDPGGILRAPIRRISPRVCHGRRRPDPKALRALKGRAVPKGVWNAALVQWPALADPRVAGHGRRRRSRVAGPLAPALGHPARLQAACGLRRGTLLWVRQRGSHHAIRSGLSSAALR